MSVKTSKIQVYPIRGMDERWVTKPNRALLIEDMTWDSQDSWKRGGGFNRAVSNYSTDTITDSDIRLVSPSYTDPEYNVSPFVTTTLSRNIDPFARTADTEDGSFSIGGTPGVPSVTFPTVKKHEETWDSIRLLKIQADRQKNEGIRLTANAYKYQANPISLHWFAQFNGGIQWLMYETSDGGFYTFFGATAPIKPWKNIINVDGRPIDGTAISRTVMSTPWAGSSFCTYAGRVYVVNGYDAPLCFDGRKATPMGFSNDIPNPEVAVSEESGRKKATLESLNWGLGYEGEKSQFKYKVTFLNERGQESTTSVDWAEVTFTNDANCTKLVTLILPIGPKGTVARRIYRTQNLRDIDGEIAGEGSPLRDAPYGEEFFFCAEIQDNVTTKFVDSRSDIHLGIYHSELKYGEVPRDSNLIAMFKNTMFYASSKSSALKFSETLRPEEVPRDNVIEIGDSIAGPITALYTTRNALVVFKTRGVYLIKGDPNQGFFCMTLSKDVGCIASKSVREIPGQGLCFFGTDGVFLLQGALENTGTITNIVRIGQPIDNHVRRINVSAAQSIRTVVNYRDHEFWLLVPLDGSYLPNALLKFHYEIGEWSVVPNFSVRDMVTTDDHRGYVYLASVDDQNAYSGLHVYSHGYDSKGAQYTLAPKYETTNMALGSAYDSFNMLRVQVWAVGYGNNDLQINYTANREMSGAYTTNSSRNQMRPLEDKLAPVFGTATWDSTSTYYEHRPVPIRFDLSSMHKGPVQEVRFDFTSDSNRIQILGYEMEVRIGSKRDVITLSEAYGGSLKR